MVIFRKQEAETIFKGTVIDLETTGNFNDAYPSSDVRRYEYHKPTIFGYLTNDILVQYCAEGFEEISRLTRIMDEVLPTLDPPFYALNCYFERGVCTYAGSVIPDPLIDVRGKNPRGRKWDIRARLGIPTYNDPFDGNGYLCKVEWEKGNYLDCLNHNRACLLIERDIMLNRVLHIIIYT